MVYDSMANNSPKPVYGKLGYSVIKTKESVRKHLYDIDKWDFYYFDGSIAKKNGIINRINDMRCYLLEDSFSKVFESRWVLIKDTFIDEVKKAHSLPGKFGERIIPEQTAKDMIEFFFMMFCRSPGFDPVGAYSWINGILNETFDDSNSEVDKIMDAIWFTELYRMFYKKKGGFYHTALAQTIDSCQMILFEASPVAGAFITSDNPAFLHKLVVETENYNGLYFPIDPQHMLFIAKGADSICKVDYRMASKELVRKFNRIIASHRIKTLVADAKDIQSFM